MKTASVSIAAGILTLMFSPITAAQDTAGLAGNVEQIIKASCYRCHGQDGAAEGRFNYVLDVPTLISRQKVIPGDAVRSKLFTVIEEQQMPPEDEQPRPSEAEIAMVKLWIDAGAADFKPAGQEREFVTSEAMLLSIASDLRSLDAFDRQFTRYFTLTHLYNAGLSDDRLQTYRLGLSRLINNLSWGRRIVVPQAIDSARTIFRIDVRDYRWTVDSWDLVLAANPFGIVYDTPTARECSAMTRTPQPHLRGDWFVFAASQPPLYHDLLEMPETDRQLEKLLQVNVAKNISERRVARAGFNGSGVSQNNRIIERHELDLTNGAYWKSYDFGTSTGRQNIFERPLGPEQSAGFQHDGGEMIFTLPNGLQAYLLVDATGARIDRGPTAIVSDPKRPDRVVINGLSCMSCHNQGMIEKDDQVRKHVEANSGAFSRTEADTILGLYPEAGKMKSYFKEDADRFARAVEKTGQKLDGRGRIAGTDSVVILAALFEQELDLNLAAAETGVTPEVFLSMLDRDSSLSRSLGPMRNKSGTVKRQAFVSVFGDLVRELRLGQFVGSTSALPIEVAREGVPLKPVPAQAAPELAVEVKQRTSVVLPGVDGVVKVRVGDIKLGKSADVEIIGSNSVSLATRRNAQVGDRIFFTSAGKKYVVEVIRFRNELISDDSARLTVQLVK